MTARVAAIVGPTAVGKTDVSLEVAEALDAEIVSVDSMQIYRGMDVGTAKPTAAMTARVPHHLIDLREPNHVLTVAEYQKLGRAAIQDISDRHKLPLLVGGSGLYFRAIVDELRFPPRSPELRRDLEEQADRLGAEELHRRLASLDPAAAAKMEPTNTRRIVRALEVIEITGRPFSDNDSWERYDSRYRLAVAGITRTRDELVERIAARVDRMLQDGLTDEAEALRGRGPGTTARQALGYRQILDAPPGAPAEQIREEIIRATKRFARRQESWFRADPRVRWFDAAQGDLATELVSYFSAAWEVP